MEEISGDPTGFRGESSAEEGGSRQARGRKLQRKRKPAFYTALQRRRGTGAGEGDFADARGALRSDFFGIELHDAGSGWRDFVYATGVFRYYECPELGWRVE